jgi:anti-anti-sigma regulatory factor
MSRGMEGASHSPLHVAVKQLDTDTALIRVCAEPIPDDCVELDEALERAAALSTPGLVIDLSVLATAEPSVVQLVTAFQERCLNGGRWLLVVPPSAQLADFLLELG